MPEKTLLDFYTSMGSAVVVVQRFLAHREDLELRLSDGRLEVGYKANWAPAATAGVYGCEATDDDWLALARMIGGIPRA